MEPPDEFYELTPEDIAVAMRDGNARKKASAGDLELRRHARVLLGVSLPFRLLNTRPLPSHLYTGGGADEDACAPRGC